MPTTLPHFPAHIGSLDAYLTAAVPGIGGTIKQHDSDFLVEEIPLYQPVGEGEHIYLFVEKHGLSTSDMLRDLARHFRVSPRAIGTAGRKDKRAITRQVVSIHTPGKSPDDFPVFEHKRIAVLWVDQHTNKLKRGHLLGNRFSIRIRGVAPTDCLHAKRTLDQLERTGVPNRFGIQRFGYLQSNHRVGRAIVLGHYQHVLDEILSPNPLAPASQGEARDAYAAADYAAARDAIPRVYRVELRLLRALADGATPEQAVGAIDPTAAGFFISAFQSAVFNDVLNRRLAAGTLDQLLLGDLAAVGTRSSLFAINETNLADPETLERLAHFEIAPSGPLWGSSMYRAEGATDETELAALRAAGLTPEAFNAPALAKIEMTSGARRPLRIKLTDPIVEGGVDEHGPFVRCAFDLPRGSFATTVMDEVMKIDPTKAEAIAQGTRADAKDSK